MPSYRLHYFPESGNSYKLALMLTLCGERFEPIWTDFGGGVTRTPEWRRDVNEMGEIPVLEVDGERLTQTAPILLKLAKQFGRFGGETEQEQFEMLRWLFWDNHKLTSYTGTYRFLRTFAPGTDKTVLEEFRKRAEGAWKVLDTQLGRAPYLAGGRLTIADISACAYLFFEDELGVSWTQYPNIDRWLGRLRAEPRWRHPYALLPGHPIPARK